jgi:hypothetical protein
MTDSSHGDPAKTEAQIRKPAIHGDPFTMEGLEEFMAQVRDAHFAETRITPHTRFMDHARSAGFNDSQCEFLWQLRLMPPPRLF